VRGVRCRVEAVGCRLQGVGYGGVGCRLQGAGCRVQDKHIYARLEYTPINTREATGRHKLWVALAMGVTHAPANYLPCPTCVSRRAPPLVMATISSLIEVFFFSCCGCSSLIEVWVCVSIRPLASPPPACIVPEHSGILPRAPSIPCPPPCARASSPPLPARALVSSLRPARV